MQYRCIYEKCYLQFIRLSHWQKMWFEFLNNAVEPFYTAKDEKDEGAYYFVYALLRDYHGNIWAIRT